MIDSNSNNVTRPCDVHLGGVRTVGGNVRLKKIYYHPHDYNNCDKHYCSIRSNILWPGFKYNGTSNVSY